MCWLPLLTSSGTSHDFWFGSGCCQQNLQSETVHSRETKQTCPVNVHDTDSNSNTNEFSQFYTINDPNNDADQFTIEHTIDDPDSNTN